MRRDVVGGITLVAGITLVVFGISCIRYAGPSRPILDTVSHPHWLVSESEELTAARLALYQAECRQYAADMAAVRAACDVRPWYERWWLVYVVGGVAVGVAGVSLIAIQVNRID